MKEVVKEILEWSDAEILYSVADNSWVSPIQCIPKKGGLTMVPNQNNELILSGTVTSWRVCADY